MLNVRKIKCIHCGVVNERDYGEVWSGIRANHFYKMRCSKCGKRTLICYKFDLVAIDDTVTLKTAQEVLETKIIE